MAYAKIISATKSLGNRGVLNITTNVNEWFDSKKDAVMFGTKWVLKYAL